jgi:hypothetical protein
MMNLGRQGYENPMQMNLNKGWQVGQVFAHELGHVWQIHNSADVKFTLNAIKTQACDMAGHDVYNADCGKAWGSYNIEQQATIIDRCYKKRENKTKPNCEEEYVVANVRRGVVFGAPQAPALPKPQTSCDDLKRKIASLDESLNERGLDINTRKAILKSIGQMKAQLKQQCN